MDSPFPFFVSFFRLYIPIPSAALEITHLFVKRFSFPKEHRQFLSRKGVTERAAPSPLFQRKVRPPHVFFSGLSIHPPLLDGRLLVPLFLQGCLCVLARALNLPFLWDPRDPILHRFFFFSLWLEYISFFSCFS